MQSYMESQIVWEGIEEYLTEHIPKKPALVFLNCVRNPKIPPMSSVNQDLFYLKNGNSGAMKYVPSLYKIHDFTFLKNDLEELNTRWVKKTIKTFNLYARYVVDHWKNPWAQQGHIRRKLKKRDNPEKVYSKKKIVDVVRVKFDQGYGFANGNIKDYRQIGLLKSLTLFIRSCVYWERVYYYQLDMESYQQKVNLTALTLVFPGIEEEKLLTITSDLVVDLIYENSKQEKRVMIIKEIPKFCNVTLKRVLEKIKKFNFDVKHGYADLDLSKEDSEYMMFYKEYIQERLRHRRWESYVNGRPLELRREHPK
ncbi:hypothetical protein Tco_0073801 [Tanacetum coccineum]